MIRQVEVSLVGHRVQRLRQVRKHRIGEVVEDLPCHASMPRKIRPPGLVRGDQPGQLALAPRWLIANPPLDLSTEHRVLVPENIGDLGERFGRAPATPTD